MRLRKMKPVEPDALDRVEKGLYCKPGEEMPKFADFLSVIAELRAAREAVKTKPHYNDAPQVRGGWELAMQHVVKRMKKASHVK